MTPGAGLVPDGFFPFVEALFEFDLFLLYRLEVELLLLEELLSHQCEPEELLEDLP